MYSERKKKFTYIVGISDIRDAPVRSLKDRLDSQAVGRLFNGVPRDGNARDGLSRGDGTLSSSHMYKREERERRRRRTMLIPCPPEQTLLEKRMLEPEFTARQSSWFRHVHPGMNEFSPI